MEIIIHRSCVVLHDVFNSICVVKFFRTFSKCSRIYTHTTTLFSNLSFPVTWIPNGVPSVFLV